MTCSHCNQPIGAVRIILADTEYCSGECLAFATIPSPVAGAPLGDCQHRDCPGLVVARQPYIDEVGREFCSETCSELENERVAERIHERGF